MKVLFLILLFAVGAMAQSANPTDYWKVYEDRQSAHFIDSTSFETVRTGVNKGNRTFWILATFIDGSSGFMSGEANCQKGLFRMRGFSTPNGFYRKTGKWMRDEVSKNYIILACAKY